MSTATLKVRLEAIRREAEGIASYELAAPDGSALPPFTAGAHIDLHLPDGLVRSYSLVNSQDERHRYLIAVYRDEGSRGGSSWLHQVPRVGDVITISPPRNDFALHEDARHSILIAGGIGITPLAAMASRLQRLGRSWRLHYAARSPEQAAFAQSLGTLAQQPGGALDLHFSSQQQARLDLARIVREAAPDAHLYCCGPAGMIDAFIAACAGRDAATVHCERFAATQEAATEGGYEVVLARNGRKLAVAAGKTILDTLLDNGIEAQYACSQGVCGTCMTTVLEGQPDHRDDYLTDAEKAANNCIMICCSGAKSARLVLDL
jgi:vanillate O-demethylase ferredoxin subunit